MKTFNYITKLAILLLVLIAFEGLITLGGAFNLEEYHWIAYVVQVLLIIVCARFAAEDWNKSI